MNTSLNLAASWKHIFGNFFHAVFDKFEENAFRNNQINHFQYHDELVLKPMKPFFASVQL